MGVGRGHVVVVVGGDVKEPQYCQIATEDSTRIMPETSE